MNDLLEHAIAAHGGLDHWNRFTSIRAELSIDGAIWHAKQVRGILLDKVIEIDMRKQHLSITPFGGERNRLVYSPGNVVIEAPDGAILEARDHPENAYVGQTFETPWDRLHAGFFASEALWTYLTLPFLYTYPGFEVEEIDPWHENGETWRSLKVTFPEYVTSHTKVQTTRFGADGLMRRHDYTVDILGGASGANYSTGYETFQGIRMPTVRRVFAYDERQQKVPSPLLVSIDLRSIVFS